MRLIEPALHRAGIVRTRLRRSLCVGRGFGLRFGCGWHGRRDPCARGDLAGRRGRSRLENRRRWSGGGVRSGCGRFHCILIGLTVCDEFVVARRARPRRNVVGHTTGPMRPVVGNVGGEPAFRSAAAARRQAQRKAEGDCTDYETLDRHGCGWFVDPARSLYRVPLIISFDRVAGY